MVKFEDVLRDTLRKKSDNLVDEKISNIDIMLKRLGTDLAEREEENAKNWLLNAVINIPAFRRFIHDRVTMERTISSEPVHRPDDMGIMRFNVGMTIKARYNFAYIEPSFTTILKFYLFEMKLWFKRKLKW